jgi:flagellar biogenesis protein FliO
MNLELASGTKTAQDNRSPDAKPCAMRAQFLTRLLCGCWRRVCGMNRHTSRRLRLCESLGLGDRRFVAVVAFDQMRFLVGGTASSLVLLARLEDDRSHKAASDPWEDRC